MLVQASTDKPTCTHTKDIIRDTQAYVDNPTPVPVHVFAYMCVGAHMLDIVHVGALRGMCVVDVPHATVTLMDTMPWWTKQQGLRVGMLQLYKS